MSTVPKDDKAAAGAGAKGHLTFGQIAKRVLSAPFILLIHFYRFCISPFTPPSCRFTPTCSRYFLDAVGEWGIAVGTVLALWRVIRCNPFSEGGYDPVPLKKDVFARIKFFFRSRFPKNQSRRSSARTPDPRITESRTPTPPEDGESHRSQPMEN